MHKDIIVRQLPNFINGEFVETGDTFDILYPITGEITAQAHKAGQKEVDAAVAAARAALVSRNPCWFSLDDTIIVPWGLTRISGATCRRW